MVPEVEDRKAPTNQQPYNSVWTVSVFAHAARKYYIDYRFRTPTISKYMKDASKRFFDIAGSHPNAFRAAVDYQPPPPTHLIRGGYGTYLPIHLTPYSGSDRPSLPYSTRPPPPALQEGKGRPVTVSAIHPMPRRPRRRRHSHVPSGHTRGFQSHTTHAYGREGVQDRHFLPPPHHKRETKKKDTNQAK
ncbi:hypothetical protein EVAR_88680_1 [Eumeta japonica]|uniref:Uncharacterized protein n=1 Tax=Eumeta variegata TaxID=151549 RepID=A0A4C1STR8_EUMVA|nr:hypothetical protein EVAR_88680_1 [Eumeta japonica]